MNCMHEVKQNKARENSPRNILRFASSTKGCSLHIICSHRIATTRHTKPFLRPPVYWTRSFIKFNRMQESKTPDLAPFPISWREGQKHFEMLDLSLSITTTSWIFSSSFPSHESLYTWTDVCHPLPKKCNANQCLSPR